MARTTLTPISSTAHGAVLSAAVAVDSANGNQFANPTGRAIIEITNGAGANINVTFTPSGVYAITSSVNYSVTADVQLLQNGTSKVFGPFNMQLMNNASGMVLVDFSSGTSITARVIEVGAA